MNCQQIDEYMFAYCDGKLSPELCSVIDEHLNTCELCRNKVQLAGMETQILADAPDIPLLSEDFTRRVMGSMLDRSSTPAGTSPSGLFNMLGRFGYYMGGTAIAAVILLALYLPGFLSLENDLKSTQIADRSIPAKESALDQTAGNVPMKEQIKYNEYETNTDSGSIAQSKSYAGDLSNAPTSASDITDEVTKSGQSPQLGSTEDHDYATTSRDNQLYTMKQPEDSHVDSDSNDMNKGPSELDLLSLHPQNLPAEYKIDRIISTTYNAITYVYTNTITNHSLEITVALINDADIKQRSFSAPAPAGLGGGSDQEYLDVDAGTQVLNSTQTNITYQGRYLEINLKSAMPLNNLQELANSISFEEELPDELIDIDIPNRE